MRRTMLPKHKPLLPWQTVTLSPALVFRFEKLLRDDLQDLKARPSPGYPTPEGHELQEAIQASEDLLKAIEEWGQRYLNNLDWRGVHRDD